MRVALVTDSTAALPVETAAAHRIVVVPLQVVVGSASYEDGDPAVGPSEVTRALRDFVPVSTSRPSPQALLDVYDKAAADGADAVLSVHLSARMSATHESAVMAAARAPIPVHVLDTRLVGAGTGYAVLAAAAVLEAGGGAQDALHAARERAARTSSFFYVDTLEYLRRGGRVGSAAALVGSALSVKPILGLLDGAVATREKVRTASRALARLEELAVEAAGAGPLDMNVCHLANIGAAEGLDRRLRERLGEQVDGDDPLAAVTEVSSVIGAHVGPGLVGVVVAPR